MVPFLPMMNPGEMASVSSLISSSSLLFSVASWTSDTSAIGGNARTEDFSGLFWLSGRKTSLLPN